LGSTEEREMWRQLISLISENGMSIYHVLLSWLWMLYGTNDLWTPSFWNNLWVTDCSLNAVIVILDWGFLPFPTSGSFPLLSKALCSRLRNMKHASELKETVKRPPFSLSLYLYLYTVCLCAPELLNHKLIIYHYCLKARESGHFLTRSGLDRLDVLLTVFAGFLMHVGCIFKENYISLFSVHMLNPAGFVLQLFLHYGFCCSSAFSFLL
jgi:hypothetical protein